MIRQPDPQQADARANTPADGISPAEAWAHVDALSMCMRLFAYLIDAQDTSMLENKYAAVGQAERWFISVLQTEDSLLRLHDTPFFNLCTKAAANSMTVVLQDTRSSLLLHCQSVEVVCALSKIVTEYARHTQKRQNIEEGLAKLRTDIAAAGLPSTLVKFTETAWQELQQLDTNSFQQQQQQPQRLKHKHKAKHHLQQQWGEQSDRCITAASLTGQLLTVWDVISNSLVSLTTLDKVLPSLIAMAAAAPTILKQAGHSCCCCSSSMNSPDLSPYDRQVRSVAATAVCMAAAIAARMVLNPKLKNLEEQQQRQQILQAEKLPDLLLQLLAHQAGKLHKMFSGVSQALHANHAAVDSGQDSEQQQQQQRQQQGDLSCKNCGVPPYHLALARSIGLGCFVVEEMVWKDDLQEIAVAYAITLAALRQVLQARHTAAQLNSSSNDNSGHDNRQQQQQQPEQQQQQPPPGGIHCVVPIHLLVPITKVLIEVLLLLPAANLTVHCSTLALIKLLLGTTATAQAAPATAEATKAAPVGAEEAPHSAAALWPQLPPAIAAGLLQPVITQLSQAVIHGLLQTDHHQCQQHQQQQQSLDQQMAAGSQRLALLHDYGCLLLVVCQAVEPKHIAAALQPQLEPDVLISLAAIEAVIRAQVCHLAPGPSLQQQLQQQQQQQPPLVYGNCNVGSDSMSFGGVWGITQQPPAHAPLLVLPSVYKVVQSMLIVFPLPTQQMQRPEFLSNKLSARLCTLLTTALKVGKCVGVCKSTLAPIVQGNHMKPTSFAPALFGRCCLCEAG